MLPLYLLTNAKGKQMSVELKNGEIIEGELTNVDNWMNITLSNVSQFDNIGSSVSVGPSKEIVKTKEVYIRGTYVKYIRLQDEIIDQVKQQIGNNNLNSNYGGGSFRGRRGGFNSPGGNSANYNRRNNPNFGGRRNFNNYSGGQRRPFNNNSHAESRPNTNGMGGYVQQHQQKDVEF